MKAITLLVMTCLALGSAQKRRYNVNILTPGRYSGDSDGQYRQDNSGAYNNDDGRYHPDDSGRYVADNLGQYAGGYEKYKHQADQFGGSGGGGGGSGNGGGSGGFGGSGSGSGGSGGTGFGSGIRRPAVGIVSGTGFSSGIASAGGFGAPVALKQGSAAGLYDNRNYAIIRKVENVEQDGYHYLYETENKIFGEEQGKLANKGTKEEAMRAKGYFEYTGPDSIVYRVEYTADENGFVPSAAHLPTPPPIPAAILRSLEYKKSIGEL